MKEFNDIEYFSDVAKIRFTIANLLQKYHCVDEVKLENAADKVNPFYGRIAKSGAFVLEFHCGLPAFIFTPYGKIQLINPETVRNVSNTDKDGLMQKLTAMFGLNVNIPDFSIGDTEKFGPWCTLTKLPWKENVKFPATFKNGIEDFTLLDAETEKQKLNAICMKVDEGFIKKGHPELVFPGFQVDDLVNNQDIQKKRRCIITGQMKQLLPVYNTNQEKI